MNVVVEAASAFAGDLGMVTGGMMPRPTFSRVLSMHKEGDNAIRFGLYLLDMIATVDLITEDAMFTCVCTASQCGPLQLDGSR